MSTYHDNLNIKTKHLDIVDWTGDSGTLIQTDSNKIILKYKDRYAISNRGSVNIKKFKIDKIGLLSHLFHYASEINNHNELGWIFYESVK